MKRSLLLIPVCLGLSAGAAAACPWAGGAYDVSEHGIRAEFTVNGDCTQIKWDRLSQPETVPLTRTKHGWIGKLEKGDVELLENGHNLRISDGGVMRQTKAKPKG